jgi:hypothetical protein
MGLRREDMYTRRGSSSASSVDAVADHLTDVDGSAADFTRTVLATERKARNPSEWRRFCGVTKSFGFPDGDGYNARLHAAQAQHDQLQKEHEVLEEAAKQRAVVAVRRETIRRQLHETRARNEINRQRAKPPAKPQLSTLPRVAHHGAVVGHGDTTLRTVRDSWADDLPLALKTPSSFAARRVIPESTPFPGTAKAEWAFMAAFPHVDGTAFTPPVVVPSAPRASAPPRPATIDFTPDDHRASPVSTPELMSDTFQAAPAGARAYLASGVSPTIPYFGASFSTPREFVPHALPQANRAVTLRDRMHRAPLSARTVGSAQRFVM